MGYVDLIIYDKSTEEYTIFDIKTSTKGWSKWEKGDETKHQQQTTIYTTQKKTISRTPLKPRRIAVRFRFAGSECIL